MNRAVTAVIPSIPPRAKLLRRALASVLAQTHTAAAVSVAVDLKREGSAVTRNRALATVQTEWCAFLDDDDQLLPQHLELLLACAEQSGADLVYPRPAEPAPRLRFGLLFDADELRRANYIPVTVLARTELVRAAGGFRCPPGSDHDDYGCWLAMLDLGARFVHLPVATWLWNGDPGQNTSGRPDRW